MKKKTGQLLGPFLLPGKTHDNAGQLPQMELEEYSLQIGDLGYFSIVDMAKKLEDNVFCLSRLRHGTVIFDEQGEEFDLSSYTLQMKKNNILRAELNVLIGKEEKLPVRLFIERVPEINIVRHTYCIDQIIATISGVYGWDKKFRTVVSQCTPIFQYFCTFFPRRETIPQAGGVLK